MFITYMKETMGSKARKRRGAEICRLMYAKARGGVGGLDQWRKKCRKKMRKLR